MACVARRVVRRRRIGMWVTFSARALPSAGPSPGRASAVWIPIRVTGAPIRGRKAGRPCAEAWSTLRRWRVAYGFDVVPVGANDEGRVVVRVVVGSQAGRTIVLGTRRDRTAIKLIDLRTTFRSES